MTDTRKPALTASQWKQALRMPPGVIYGFEDDEGEMSRHRMAAMCLHGTPEGFTHEDVLMLELEADMIDISGGDKPAMLNLAARIAALLPPER